MTYLEDMRERFEIKYKITRIGLTGQGSRGDVYEGEMGGCRVAIKVMRTTRTSKAQADHRLVRELRIWSHLSHRYIAPLFGLTYDQDSPGIVSLFIENGIMRYTSQYPDAKLRLIHETALGLQYSHAQSAIHGDLTPNNVRVAADGHAKIIDFGMGRLDNVQGFTSSWNPNPRYNGPEVLQDDAIHMTMKSDVYTFAMLMLQVLHGHDFRRMDAETGIVEDDASIPFNDFIGDGPALLRVYAAVVEGRRPLQANYRNITQQQWSLLESCWHQDPRERPSMTTIVEYLQYY